MRAQRAIRGDRVARGHHSRQAGSPGVPDRGGQVGRLPARSVVFEDATFGIQAAKAAGMYAVGVTTTHPVASWPNRAPTWWSRAWSGTTSIGSWRGCGPTNTIHGNPPIYQTDRQRQRIA